MDGLDILLMRGDLDLSLMKGVAFGWSGHTTNGGDLDLSLMKGVAFGWSGHTTNGGGLRLKPDERGGLWLVWTYY